jgi:hypothetical protein
MTAERDNFNQVLQKILDELTSMKSKFPNGELESMSTQIRSLKETQQGVKDDISEIKKKLFNPEDGVIVKVNETRKFMQRQEDREEDFNQLVLDIEGLKKWQSGVNKALWILFGALTGLTIQLLMVLYSK